MYGAGPDLRMGGIVSAVAVLLRGASVAASQAGQCGGLVQRAAVAGQCSAPALTQCRRPRIVARANRRLTGDEGPCEQA
jgi:hypothetical protein